MKKLVVVSGMLVTAVVLAGCVVEAPAGEFCPTAVRALVQEDGTVVVSWAAVDGADGYNVYGPRPDGDLLFLGHTQGLSMIDEGHASDQPRLYLVTATFGEDESADCVPVEAVLVPVFPGAVAWSLAGAVTIGCAAWVAGTRRRHA